MLPKEWLSKEGEGTTVGIIDTTVDLTLPQIRNSVKEERAFGRTSTRHGTFIVSTIHSIAKRASLVVAHGDLDRVEEMLEWMVQFKLDVLNCSWAFFEPKQNVMRLLEEIADKGTIVVCAYSKDFPYPWSNRRFISAGEEIPVKPEHSLQVNSLLLSTMRGNSVAAALVSGTTALGRAVIPSIDKKTLISRIRPEDIPSRLYRQSKQRIIEI